MDTVNLKESERQALPPLRRSTKLLYGVGSVAYGVKDLAFRTFLLLYYNQVVGVPATLVSAAILVTLLVDAVSDPIVGQLSDNFRSRWGRRHPFMYASAIPAAGTFLLLWMPPEGLSDGQMFAYIVVVACAVRTFITFYEIPSSALAPELTSDYNERTTIASYRYFFGVVGGMGVTSFTLSVILAPTAEYPIGQLNPTGYLTFGLFGAAIMIATVLLSTGGTQHRVKYFDAPPPKEKKPVWQTLKGMLSTLKHPGFMGIFIYGVLHQAGLGIGGALKLYFGTYLWQLTSQQLGILVLDMAVAAAIALVLAPWISRRFGKRNAALILVLVAITVGLLPYALRLAGLFFENGDPLLLPALFTLECIYYSCGIVSAILVHAMIGDVTTDSQVATGKRTEGLFYAANSFQQKCASGVGVFLAGLLVDAVGLQQGSDPRTVDMAIPENLAVIYIPVLGGLYFIGALFLLMYKIDARSHAENVRSLDERRRAEAERAAGAEPAVVPGVRAADGEAST